MRASARWVAIMLLAGVAAGGADPRDSSFDRKKALSELRERIAGHEQEPAEKVFQDIQLFKGMPAARLLAVMEVGFARSLGVDCTHCHVARAWGKNDKQQN